MERKIYAFDLDGTLCDGKPREGEPIPIQERIDIVNKLYRLGHVIIIFTARDFNMFNDTVIWLLKYGIMFHGINMRLKPGADYYIDDKGINAELFFNNYKDFIPVNN